MSPCLPSLAREEEGATHCVLPGPHAQAISSFLRQVSHSDGYWARHWRRVQFFFFFFSYPSCIIIISSRTRGYDGRFSSAMLSKKSELYPVARVVGCIIFRGHSMNVMTCVPGKENGGFPSFRFFFVFCSWGPVSVSSFAFWAKGTVLLVS